MHTDDALRRPEAPRVGLGREWVPHVPPRYFALSIVGSVAIELRGRGGKLTRQARHTRRQGGKAAAYVADASACAVSEHRHIGTDQSADGHRHGDAAAMVVGK